LIRSKLEQMKVKVVVPNSRISKETLVEEGPESESIMASGDERSETAISSPVIKVYGSTGVEASALETTEMGDRNNLYGA